MANKRAPPKDLDASLVQSKQPRLETMSQSAFYDPKPVGSAQYTENSSQPATELRVSTPIPISPMTPIVSSSPMRVIGVPTWSNPGKTPLDFHSSQGDAAYILPITPTQKRPDLISTLQQDSPLFVVPIGSKQEINVPGSQFMCSALPKQGAVPASATDDHTCSVAVSSGVLETASPYPMPGVGGVIPTSELLHYADTSSKQSYSSSSQLHHVPVSNSSSHFSNSTTYSTLLSTNRQPVCLSGRSNWKGEPKTDQKTMKHRVLKYHRARLASLKLKHEVDLKEKFFLETGGNMMDIVTWKKRPSAKRDKYLKLYDIESEASPCDQHTLSPDFRNSPSHANVESAHKYEAAIHKHEKHSKQQKGKSEVAEGGSISSTTIQIPLSTVSHSLRAVTPSSPVKTPQISASSPRPVTRLHSSFSSFYETSHEDIVMRARHEAEVMRAISDLRKEGLWSSSRLPKVHEPSHKKTHWDYMLEEMQWLAADFANERRWKVNAARKISRSISGYYRELEMQQVRTEKEEALKLKKIALSIAKEIKHFWDSIQKVVLHKQQLLLEEKKKRAMDMHLEFIVDQTAKYSNWLVKGLTTSSTATPSEPSLHSAAVSVEDSDAFLTPEETSDDEETIEKEEQLMEIEDGKPNYATEIKTLEEEGAIPLEQLLASLPSELLKKDWMMTGADETNEEIIVRDHDSANSGVEEVEASTERLDTSPGVEEDKLQKSIADVDDDKVCDSEDRGASHEQGYSKLVITEGHKVPEKKTYKDESNNESVNEGSKRLDACTLSSEDSGDEADSETSYGEEESGDDGDLEFLVSGKTVEEVCQTEAGFSDVAAVAEQFQPKGITLATTEVKTKIPFLLKHSLREYQHIGLDWLVAMHEKRLNGILADEMGLGKTIQTIALLAHLACEEGNWGPHLIVVPTSVMLNWEYELKKWCPAFKLLTYFGSFKERKQKRIGWTKRNAFHVCITSYNIAVTDHRAFKQMKWKYLVLDEAQNIKNFKSQRWQTLLAFNSQRRLLLTGTPLQNNLMELWSLMHFLMPSVFSSHSDFREWFSNPLTGMVEGSQEYNDSIVKRLHQVLRPFLLRRLKMEVEKQMPKKYEHVVICRLSKRQRFLYDEYMSRRKTKDTLAAGNYLSVINILMQLRKVCNHPDLFEPRPTVSPLRLAALEFYTASLLFTVYDHNPFKNVCLDHLNLRLANCELDTEAFAAFRSRQLQAPKALICDPIRSQFEDKDEEEQEKNASLFLEDLCLPYLAYSRQEWSLSRRKHMHEVNTRRCRRIPMYGIDLVKAVRNMSESSRKQAASSLPWSVLRWLWCGYMACKRQLISGHSWDECSSALQALLLTYEQRTSTQEEILKRFVITVPPVTAPCISVHTHLYTPASLSHDSLLTDRIARHLAPCSTLFHLTSTSMSMQFPETRLIQYDCGKLQTLDVLLRTLKAGNHRVLVFTQMARVLDILEIFLNYHGHTYLRLDGATPVQKRQVLMDRFNHDERIFCFILSTRSGGLGVNLTGADTVVFYDSDWNPTMDAQAQDRCHRIGQTRDVHIYRLVCESTVEENILKKANQKRMLGDIAIEGGVFTTDFFKEATLRDLFQVKPEVQEVPLQNDSASDSQMEAEDASLSSKCIEDLLMQAEDERDVQAASMAKAEQVAEKAEFDEDFCAQVDREQTSERYPDPECNSKAVTEFAAIEQQLSGIERYAMRYLEEENADIAAEQLKLAEESIKQAKKSWELSHMQSLREEEERIAEEDAEDDIMLSYDRPELANKIFVDKETGEEMPMWLPPTPPVDDNDEFYVDVMMDMAYDTSSVITPAELASIAPYSEEDYDVLGLSRRYLETESSKKPQKSSSKLALKEHVNVPPSLFWRRYATDTLSTKLKKLASHQKKLKVKDQFTPLLEPQPEGPEWSLYEDWLLLKGITEVLEFPLSLAVTVPAQIPNWSIIADLISLLSQMRRSPLQCREHLMNVVIPREDSLVKGDDSVESKKHKSKDGVSKKMKSRKEQKIKQSVVNDGGQEQTKLFTASFDKVLETVSKRKQKTKFSLDAIQKPSIHTDLMKSYDIRMDSVLSPMQIAHRRVQPVDTSRGSQGSQVQQLLSSQPHQASLMRGYGAAGTPFMKVSTGYNLPRQISTSIAISTAPVQRFQSVSSASTSFTSSQLPQVTSTTIPSPVLPNTSQATPSSTSSSQQSTPLPLLPPKTLNVSSISDISKTLRGNLTHQQLLMLRQSTLQQQANTNPQSSAHVTRPLIAQQQTAPPIQAPPPSVTQKVALPSGIEQLRASIALPSQQRFGAITSVSGARGLAGRNLQTEDVLALLKQQSLRIAATQSYKAGHTVPSLHPPAHFPFRPESGHSTAKVQHVPTAIVPPEAIKLVSTSSTTAMSVAEVQQKVGVEGVTTKQFSTPATTAAVNVTFGPQQPSNSVITTAAQNLVKAQIQQVLAQQQLKSQHGGQIPKTTSQ